MLLMSGIARATEDLEARIAAVAAAPAPIVVNDAYAALLRTLDGDLGPAATLERIAARARSYRDTLVARHEVPARLARLRAELARRGLAGFVIPRGDEHQGEYVPPRAQRLTWLTGFTGSAGLAIVLADHAALFVDGRYTLQVRDEVDGTLFAFLHITESPPATWLAKCLPAGGVLGYDPWLHGEAEVRRLAEACARAGGRLAAQADNPIDAIWPDQPPPPLAPIVPHPLAFAGESTADKRRRLGEALTADALDAAILTAPDSIAWLLNVRGADVENTPLPLSFAVLRSDGQVDWFVDARKLAAGVPAHLGNGVSIQEPGALSEALAALGRAKRRVRVDPGSAIAILDRLGAAGAEAVRGEDPCAAPKAIKNATEIAGLRAAHRRDGAALTRFLAWLAAEAPQGTLDELTAVAKLADLRRGGEHFRGFSFDTISAAGANGAIVHYRAEPATNRRLEAGQLYLVDSGAQYLDGTTDVTRTVAIGTPSAEQCDRFTRVLKGHIALATCRFPVGTSGSQLDVLARTALWQAGLDYDHGTGHGVGSYLCVHEGPHRISKIPNTVALKPGMVVSNEPGYYKTGAFGIRIENLVLVTAAEVVGGSEREFLAFETLTLAPIDRHLVDAALLTGAETAWLDAYHARVRAALTPLLDAGAARWLAAATARLGG
ncbi:MAG: aminopeptidase P family protein [Alphaproteobacteria bacterium]|nr:aminopeptidase P family protein [Alphaproteobacteria bacterium]